jgi:hypothetical protein
MTSNNPAPQDGPVRAEIQFFMDKLFQMSLGYIVGLGAILALSNSAMINGFAQATKMTITDVILCLLLLLNVIYLTLATACLFAVLKRGLFALTHSIDVSGTWHQWEVFVRREAQWKITNRLSTLAWNVDNYYAIPIVFVVGLMSVLAATFCLTSHAVNAIIAAIFLCCLHIIPLWMLWQLKNLNSFCRMQISRTIADEQSPDPQPPSET